MWSTTLRLRRPGFARPVCRAAWLIASLSACSALAGCGSTTPSPPALARADAAPLAALAQRIAAEGACAQARDIPALQRQAVALVDRGAVPARLQEPFMSGVNALTADAPPCVPPVAVAPPAAPPPPHGHGHDHKHGPGKHGGD